MALGQISTPHGDKGGRPHGGVRRPGQAEDGEPSWLARLNEDCVTEKASDVAYRVVAGCPPIPQDCCASIQTMKVRSTSLCFDARWAGRAQSRKQKRMDFA